MNNEIIEMVNKVGCKSYSPPPMRAVAGVSMTFAQVEALIKLAAEREREACEKVCEAHANAYLLIQSPVAKAAWAACIDNRDAIRARGES